MNGKFAYAGDRPVDVEGLVAHVRANAPKKRLEGIRYDFSPAASAEFFGGGAAAYVEEEDGYMRRAGFFEDNLHRTHDGFLLIRDTIDANQKLKHRMETRPEGLTMVVRAADEGWKYTPRDADVTCFAQYAHEQQRIAEMVRAGVHPTAIDAAKRLMNGNAFMFFEEIAHEGLGHLLTPSLVEEAYEFAREQKLPVALGAAHYVASEAEENPRKLRFDAQALRKQASAD
jgi:hypothetical protein